MTIRKGSLWKICKKCGKSFEPTGKFCRFCDKCKPQGFSWINQLAKQRKIERKNMGNYQRLDH